MDTIHFNHAGAGLPSPETVHSIIDQLKLEAAFGPMEAASMVSAQQENTYQLAARLLNCNPEQVVVGSGHGQLFGDIVSAIPVKAGETILVSRQEWVGNITCLENVAKLASASLTLMASDEHTAVDVDALKQALSPDVRIVCLTWIGASGALINPAEAIGKAIRDSGSSALYIIDASQAVGQIPIDVHELCCDALVACGRKYLRAPRGTALAYISPRLAAQAVPRKLENIASINTPKMFEMSEASAALKAGLGQAIKQALEYGIATTRETLVQNASALRQALGTIPAVQILDMGTDMAACVTFRLSGVTCSYVKATLASQGINIGMNGREYTPYDLDLRNITEILRASVHVSTTRRDIHKLVAAITEIASSNSNAKWTFL